MRRFHTNRARLLGAFVGLAALGSSCAALSGCGASATIDPIAQAAEVSSQQEGAQISFSAQFSAPELPGGSVSISANGYIDQREHSGELSFDLSKIPGIAALGGAAGETVELMYAYPKVYLHVPFLANKFLGGKTWLEVDLEELAEGAGKKLPQLSSLEQADPTRLLEYLRASSGEVTTVGTETLDGVSTTHYRATLAISSILEHIPGDERAAAEAGLEKLAGSADGGIPVDVWIDAQNRVRRGRVSFNGESVSATVTLDYTSYGPVPAVVPPPASEVYDASSSLIGGANVTHGGYRFPELPPGAHSPHGASYR